MFITRKSQVLSSHTYTNFPFLLSDLYPERKKGGKKGGRGEMPADALSGNTLD